VNANESQLIQLIKFHQANKRNVSIQDVYKLLYQSTFGVAHILNNIANARKYLHEEIFQLTASREEPLLESISTNGEMIRINLRPFKAQLRNIDVLFEVMQISAEQTFGTLDEFLKKWDCFKNAVTDFRLNFNIDELKLFDKKITAEFYPALHHSEKYRSANKPAYRVVKKSVFNAYFKTD